MLQVALVLGSEPVVGNKVVKEIIESPSEVGFQSDNMTLVMP